MLMKEMSAALKMNTVQFCRELKMNAPSDFPPFNFLGVHLRVVKEVPHTPGRTRGCTNDPRGLVLEDVGLGLFPVAGLRDIPALTVRLRSADIEGFQPDYVEVPAFGIGYLA